MRIGIDIQTTLGEKTGFGFYVKNLVANLRKIDHENQYFFFRPEVDKDLSVSRRFIWDQLHIPRLARRSKIDVLHQPCFSVPIFFNSKTVVTVHDLIVRLYGKDIPFFARGFFGRWMPLSYAWADHIICDSEHTKKDLMKLLKIPEKKITVVYLAVGGEFQPLADKEKISKIKSKYATGEKYLLNVGTICPRKNLNFLIGVFEKVCRDFPDYKLVITGKKGWYYNSLFNLIKTLHLKNKIIFTGYIADEDAPYLYNGAEAFLFPSLYEGFGLPPLEAMACGVPVICSSASSLPEVVGQGGILLSPKDAVGWVRTIKKVLADKKLRANMSRGGLNQAKKFSWEKCARETLQVYKDVYENRS